MGYTIKETIWKLRRQLLKTLVPEGIWPKEVNIDGVSIKLRSTPYSFGTKLLLKKGTYEASERKLLKQELLPNDIVIEMGGSIGILTALTAHYIPSGRVISIEASQEITLFSKTWLEQRSNINIITGFGFPVYSLQKQLKIETFNESAGSLGGTLTYSIKDGINTNETVYDLKKINTLLNIEPTVLIIDIEGSESILLEQEACFPISIRMILMELHPHIYGKDKMQRIITCIIQEGYQITANDAHVYLFKRIK